MPTLHLDLAPTHEEIARLLQAVEAFVAPFELPPKPIQQFLVSLEEMVLNAIHYGGQDAPSAGPNVFVTLDGNELSCEIIDRGIPFNPFTDAPPPDLSSPLPDRRVGGLGIHIAKTLMDSCSYERRDGLNHTVLRKRL